MSFPTTEGVVRSTGVSEVELASENRRKIIIEAHGGGAFSGKDPTKVDRSGAYVVSQAAKSIITNGLASRCIVQVSYAIGVPEPLFVFVDTYGTGKIPDKEILEIVKENFDLKGPG